MLEEKTRSLMELQATHELQIKQLRMELDNECEKQANIKFKLEGIMHLKIFLWFCAFPHHGFLSDLAFFS